jgi:hypothetical protein
MSSRRWLGARAPALGAFLLAGLSAVLGQAQEGPGQLKISKDDCPEGCPKEGVAATTSTSPCVPVKGEPPPPGATAWDLQTDAGVGIGHTIVRDKGPVDDPERFEKHKKTAMVDAGAGYVLEPPSRGYNCHGFTLARGRSEVESADVDKAFQDNYTPVPGVRACTAAAQVCDVIAWRASEQDAPDHTGLVVAVDGNNKVTMVASKFGGRGGLFAHPPDAWAPDWEIHRRKAPPAGPEIDGLKKKLGDAGKDLRDRKITPEQFYRTAADLCQAWNELTRVAQK